MRKGKDERGSMCFSSFPTFVLSSLCGLIFAISTGIGAESCFEGLELPAIPYEWNRTPYIYCNERNQDLLLQNLVNLPKVENGVHVGWSIELNYKILLARRPKIAFLCDINQRVFEFYELLKELFLTSDTGIEFIHRLKVELEARSGFFSSNPLSKANSDRFTARNIKVDISKVISRFSSWILPDGNYEVLKAFYTEGRICHVVLNVVDHTGRFAVIGDWIKSQGYTVDTVYFSNINTLAKFGNVFRENFKRLITENTLCVDANDKLFLRVTRGALPKLPW